MRNIVAKITTLRTATAEATLRVNPETILAIREGRVPKGDALTVAKVAAIQAAKTTPALIPYCHHVPIEAADIDFELGVDSIRVTASVSAIYKTGVEMEALTAASVAALNLYDMLKMIDEDMSIEGVRLLEKRGGKSDFRRPTGRAFRSSVVVVSDSVSAGKAGDRSGSTICAALRSFGSDCADPLVIPDESDRIACEVTRAADARLDLLVITGGTGLGPRDVTPEAVRGHLDRTLPGVEEAIRAYGQQRTPFAMLSRTLAGVRGRTLVLCLPGSVSGVEDALAAVFPAILHALEVMEGAGHN